jgi:hypothetical protein
MKLPAGAFHGELSEGSRNVKLNRVHGEFSDVARQGSCASVRLSLSLANLKNRFAC